MTQLEALDYFSEHHPGCNVVLIPAENPTEIICEIDPAHDHTEYSVAIAAILESVPHYHALSTETYKVLRGNLTLHVDDEIIRLSQDDSYTIKPGQIHFSQGDFSLVEVRSEPGWTNDDHIIVK